MGVVPDVDVSSEGGLLGIVASSTFNDDRTVFASVSGAEENRIVALTIADDYASFAVGRVLLDGIRTADRTMVAPSGLSNERCNWGCWLLAGCRESAVEGDVEGVQCMVQRAWPLPVGSSDMMAM
ncbi:hypothetical protein M2271_008272 [Streptomyces sp. LBL]|nr:hypothetical protein [Streptomyces sp. LBL]